MAQGENIVALQGFRADPAGTGGRAAKELAAGTTLLHGQYTLMGYLDSGGFGITYRAMDSLGRSVVLKECFPDELCLRAGKDVLVRNPAHARDLASIIGQFVAEARSLAKLRHRGIVEVHQVFMENETAYIAMEHVDGPDLLSLIEDTRRKFRPTEVERIAMKLLKAVGYVHKRGLLHRDISPDNILIERGGQPKLIDFGAVRGHDGDEGWQLKCVKDGYSPDEFYDPTRRHGPESDIYSLGATLHHMVTGAAPVDAEMRGRAIAQGQGDPYLPIEGRYRGYTRGFLAAIDRALSFRPEDRHPTARDWAKFIAKAAAAAPVVREASRPLYEEKTAEPVEAEADGTPPRDVMPWVGVAAAVAGVLLSLYGPEDILAPAPSRGTEMAGFAAPQVESSAMVVGPGVVDGYRPAGVPGAVVPSSGELGLAVGIETPSVPVVGRVPSGAVAPVALGMDAPLAGAWDRPETPSVAALPLVATDGRALPAQGSTWPPQ